MEDIVCTHQLRVHLEATEDADAPFVWWAESDQLSGFSAAADTLADLIVQSTAAVAEIFGEGADVRFVLAPGQGRDAAGDLDRSPSERQQPGARSVSVFASPIAA